MAPPQPEDEWTLVRGKRGRRSNGGRVPHGHDAPATAAAAATTKIATAASAATIEGKLEGVWSWALRYTRECAASAGTSTTLSKASPFEEQAMALRPLSYRDGAAAGPSVRLAAD